MFGATFIALPILLEAICWLRQRFSFTLLVRNISTVLSMALLLYVAVFYVHFKLLPLSGPDDNHMTKEFQMGLIGNKYTGDTVQPTMNFIEQFVEVHKEMFRANQHMSKHPASSH
jgi:dolichyl-phosphate-mannose--protein O-mannosyl transferase